MARKQSDYLAALLAEEEAEAPAPVRETVAERSRGTTLLGRSPRSPVSPAARCGRSRSCCSTPRG